LSNPPDEKYLVHKPFITIGAAIGCSVSIALIFLVLLFFIIIPGRHNSNKNCQAALDVRDAVVFILSDAQKQAPESSNSNKFYSRAFNKLKNIKCRS